MATILIVDDRATNREFLVTLLGYGDHRLLEAGDGAEALNIARLERPNLVITDILMPTMDGYELVRQLRAEPALAQIPVIFYTAHYHEQQARALARACGVAQVLSKPAEPETVLGAVQAALDNVPPPVSLPPTEEFDRKHLRLVTDKLSQKVNDLRKTNARLSTLVDLGLQLGSELDLRRLLQSFNHAARKIIGARYATAAIADTGESAVRCVFTSGMDPETAARLGSPDPRADVLKPVLGDGRCVRQHNPDGDPVTMGLSSSYPPIHGFLAAPIASPTRIYGWLALIDKVGGDAFSDEDERLASMLAAQVGRIYQNGNLYAETLRHASELEREVAERKRAEQRQATLLAVSQALAESTTLRDAAERVLRAICESLGWELGAMWVVEPAANVLRCLKIWNAPSDQLSEWKEHTRQMTLAPGVGLPGRVWHEGKLAWVPDVSKEGNFPRAAIAAKSGLHAAIAFPIVFADQVLGVVEFFSPRFREPDQDLLQLFSGISGPLGQFMERKRTKQALRERDEQVRLLLDSTAEAIYGIDSRGHCTFANSACCRLLGYSDSRQFLDQDMHVLIHHTRVDGSQYPVQDCSIFQAFLRGEGTHVDDEVLWRADGSCFAAEYWSHPIRRDGQVVGAVVTFLDISQRRQAEQAQRRTAAERDALLKRLQLQIERMPLGYLLFDADSRIIDWNSAAEGIFGYCKDEMLGEAPPFEKIVPVADKPHTLDVLRRINCGDMAAHSINDNLTKDGRTITCEWYNTPLHAEDGEFRGFISLALDITERRKLERQFQEAQARLQHVVASSPAVLYTLAIEGDWFRPTWVGANMSAMMGHSAEDALQLDWWPRHVHPEDIERAREEIRQGLFGPGRVAHEHRFRHQDGTYRWVRSEMLLLRDAAGNPVEVVGSWSDITDRRQLEEQFRQAQKMEAIGRLAGGVAHDFNNLLTVINGYSEVMLDQLRPNDPLRTMAVQIKKSGERAAGLTRQLLAFSRKQVLAPVALNVNALLADMERMLRRLIGEDIELKVTSDPAPGQIKADPGQIEQIIMNIIINARDAMPQGGKITVETRNVDLDNDYVSLHADTRPGRHVLLAISDTGCGMDPATQARIFEPFFSTKGEKGTGLGLATVFGIVKQSGGHIEVYSEPGVGTTFKIYLPHDATASPAVEPRVTLHGSLRGTETILLTEDEEAVRGLARSVLESYGYTVLEARNGGEALLACELNAAPIHLLITDVVMPNMSGPQLAKRLAALRPDMRVLYLSGYTDDAIVHHGVLEPGTQFLQKPFSPAALARKVRDVLDEK